MMGSKEKQMNKEELHLFTLELINTIKNQVVNVALDIETKTISKDFYYTEMSYLNNRLLFLLNSFKDLD